MLGKVDRAQGGLAPVIDSAVLRSFHPQLIQDMDDRRARTGKLDHRIACDERLKVG
jgi:hypothetical protein